jgi:hypothetical protein
MLLRLNVDVVGVFRFLSIPVRETTIERFIHQITIEFDEIYRLQHGLSVQALFVARDSVPVTLNPASRVDDVLRDNDIVFVSPSEHWMAILRTSPWDLLAISRAEFEDRVGLLRALFSQEANVPALRSCLMRAAGSVGKATYFASALSIQVLGIPTRLVFTRAPAAGTVHETGPALTANSGRAAPPVPERHGVAAAPQSQFAAPGETGMLEGEASSGRVGVNGTGDGSADDTGSAFRASTGTLSRSGSPLSLEADSLDDLLDDDGGEVEDDELDGDDVSPATHSPSAHSLSPSFSPQVLSGA